MTHPSVPTHRLHGTQPPPPGRGQLPNFPLSTRCDAMNIIKDREEPSPKFGNCPLPCPLPSAGGLFTILFLIAVCALTTSVAAQETDPPQTPPPAPPTCDLAEHRQFDFWIGEWAVTNADGSAAGVNVIEKVLGGCALHESWTSATGGFSGNSYNIYSRAKGKWHQTWVDTTGNLLEIEGGIVDGKMVLEGPGRAPDGKPIVNRITWTPNADGSVRQHWQVSSDGGATWTDAFDGLYKKKR